MDSSQKAAITARAVNILYILNRMTCGASIHKIANLRALATSVLDCVESDTIPLEKCDDILTRVERETADIFKRKYYQ